MDYEKKLKDALKDENTDYEVVRWIESNFPEIAESVDGNNKRISNEITRFLKQNNGWNSEWLAWLEKQGEQKVVEPSRDYNDIDPHFGKFLDFKAEHFSEQESKSYKDAEEASVEYRKFREECGIKDIVMLDEIEEAYYNGATSIQKPAWNDEDSKMFNTCCDFLTDEECVWLKSLKDRLKGG